MQYGSKLIPKLASELGLLICCLLLAVRAISGYDSVSTFSHIEKIATFQTLKNKIDKLVGIIDFGEFSSLFLESLSAVTSMQYVIFMKKNKSGSSVNELQYS